MQTIPANIICIGFYLNIFIYNRFRNLIRFYYQYSCLLGFKNLFGIFYFVYFYKFHRLTYLFIR